MAKEPKPTVKLNKKIAQLGYAHTSTLVVPWLWNVLFS